MNEVASRYANALFSIALEEDNVLTLQNEGKIVNKLLKDNEEFISVLGSYFLAVEERKAILEKTFNSLSTTMLNFLKVIIDHNRVNEMCDILTSFNSLCNDNRGVLEGRLYSIRKLKEEQIKRIETKISKLEKCDVELINIIDSTLIGGVKVAINGHIYDGSVENYLTNLEKSLLKKED